MSTEIQNVIDRYDKRKSDSNVLKNAKNIYFNHYSQSEIALKYTEIINSKFESLESIKILEIGAGTGGNLYHLKRLGFKWENIYANELLSERYCLLKETFPNIHIYEGDACQIDDKMKNAFDIVFQSLVFTSILDIDFRKNLSEKMWSLLKPNGFILWYDFAFDNPKNSDVKGIKKKEISKLFPEAKKITFYKTTLAPPIGRRVKKLYPLFNMFPFLRTHLIAVIEK